MDPPTFSRNGSAADEVVGHDSSPPPRFRRTRREFLLLGAGAGLASIAGCSAPSSGTSETPNNSQVTNTPAETRSEQIANGGNSEFSQLYRQTADSVTLVETSTGSGSGWVIDEQGRIVTNEHVVESEAQVDIRFDADEWRTADVLGTDPIGDLAVVEPADPPSYATPLPLAVDAPAVGSDVAIIGAPYGLPGSLSVGVVSGTNRFLDSPTGSSIPGAIQVDATANPGNSGGPILLSDGEVVGVLNSGTGVAVNFGIPGRLVDAVIPALIDQGTYNYSTLGVSLVEVTPSIARGNSLDAVTGVLVSDVGRGSAAESYLRGSSRIVRLDGNAVPVGGDVIVGLDGRTITSLEEYASYLTFSTRPGDTIDVTVLRDGSQRTVELTVGSRSGVR